MIGLFFFMFIGVLYFIQTGKEVSRECDNKRKAIQAGKEWYSDARGRTRLVKDDRLVILTWDWKTHHRICQDAHTFEVIRDYTAEKDEQKRLKAKEQGQYYYVPEYNYDIHVSVAPVNNDTAYQCPHHYVRLVENNRRVIIITVCYHPDPNRIGFVRSNFWYDIDERLLLRKTDYQKQKDLTRTKDKIVPEEEAIKRFNQRPFEERNEWSYDI